MYDLNLTLNSETDEILGQVVIEMQCRNETSSIQLHMDPLFLYVQYAVLENRLTNISIDAGIPEIDWNREILEFHLNMTLETSYVYYLKIWFVAKYSDDEHGITRNSDLIHGTWINTFFEPTYARRLFPCFDEPKWRAIFKLKLWLYGEFADSSFVALSNTRSNRLNWRENLTIFEFEATPPLPIYLFSFAIGKFRSHCSEKYLPDREMCIWRFHNFIDWERMAEKIMKAAASYQTRMTKELASDPVARLYFLIVPMRLNGMEHYGLLNIKEALWPKYDDDYSFYKFSKTLYHEMAHQWFGNLVTVEWWDSIWLAEGLATFTSSARPIFFDPAHDLTVDSLVSKKWATRIPTIVYTKSATLLEMVESMIGSEQMSKFLRDYVKVFAFGWANTESFLQLMKASIGEQDMRIDRVAEFLHVWLHQESHPIVFIDYDKSLSQFLLSQTPKLGPRINRWPIPVWVDCLEATVPERLYWIERDKQLILNLHEITTTNLTTKVAFNRNRPVYYQMSFRY
ncbi:peptidase family m1 domain-containing protein [Ditylenchus destructor]|nr:peptidase family m1 domain-containing protein [Ditylenchus destructor]